MHILGVNISHHASVCLLKDGEIVFYIEDDRISRLKERDWTPISTCHALLKIAKYTKHVEYLSIATFGRVPYTEVNSTLDYTDEDIITNVLETLKEAGITVGEILFLPEHHLFHASNAFYSSCFPEAVALVMDGGGYPHPEYKSHREMESIFQCFGGEIKKVHKHYGIDFVFSKADREGGDPLDKHPANIQAQIDEKTLVTPTGSCGNAFRAIGGHCEINSPGKLMGLAPYGENRPGEVPFFKYLKNLDAWVTDYRAMEKYALQFVQGNDSSPYERPEIPLKDKMHLCKVLQDETCKHTVRILKKIIENTQTPNIVLSGGYFLNCVNNYVYTREFPEVNFYIDPLAHDGGTAMGAARHVWHVLLGHRERHPLKHLYLG